jgi:hypothetical protein
MAGTDGEDENEDGGLKGLLQNGIVIVIRYERQQESKIPWHMRFTPSWQFTLEDRLDHQRRRMRQVYTTTTARTDGPGSEVYMGKEIALTSDDLMAYSITAQLATGTIESREPDDGRNVLKMDALVAGLRTSNVRNISGERRCGKGSYAHSGAASGNRPEDSWTDEAGTSGEVSDGNGVTRWVGNYSSKLASCSMRGADRAYRRSPRILAFQASKPSLKVWDLL